MKKIFLFAIAAVALTVGCQKSQITAPEVDPLDDGTPVPVVFGTNVATVSTKAAVDGTAFSGQTLHIYGVNDAATDWNNSESFLTNMNPATVEVSDNEITIDNAYYGVNKETYSFFGYHVGDATTNATKTNATLSVSVTIDGDDDILIGKADKATDVASSGLTVADLYSAKSARKDVKPNLTFNHELVRFDFMIKNGTTLNGEETITIDKIAVKSVATGTLKFPEASLTPEVTPKTSDGKVDETQLATFDLVPESLAFDASTAVDAVESAGNIMVMPGLEAYPLALTVTSNGQVATSNLAIQGNFTKGYKYEVTVVVYGLEAVILSVKLVDWQTGDPVVIDPDK